MYNLPKVTAAKWWGQSSTQPRQSSFTVYTPTSSLHCLHCVLCKRVGVQGRKFLSRLSEISSLWMRTDPVTLESLPFAICPRGSAVACWEHTYEHTVCCQGAGLGLGIEGWVVMLCWTSLGKAAPGRGTSMYCRECPDRIREVQMVHLSCRILPLPVRKCFERIPWLFVGFSVSHTSEK